MDEEIRNALAAIESGGLILYPTDTVWGIGCDATNPTAIDKIYKLKKRSDSKSMICLVNDYRMLNKHIEHVPPVAYEILKFAAKPTTIIYDRPLQVAENIIAGDDSLAVRVVKDDFCQRLITCFGNPIVSTSANISGEKTPESFEEITLEILEGVDYVVNLHRDKKSIEPSTIIRLKNNGQMKVLRK